MGTYQLRFIFGIGWSEASLKFAGNFFKNSFQENISIYDQRYKLPKIVLLSFEKFKSNVFH